MVYVDKGMTNTIFFFFLNLKLNGLTPGVIHLVVCPGLRKGNRSQLGNSSLAKEGGVFSLLVGKHWCLALVG